MVKVEAEKTYVVKVGSINTATFYKVANIMGGLGLRSYGIDFKKHYSLVEFKGSMAVFLEMIEELKGAGYNILQ